MRTIVNGVPLETSQEDPTYFQKQALEIPTKLVGDKPFDDSKESRMPLEVSKEEIIKAVGAGYIIKDSGKRAEFAGGMVRDTSEGKVRYNRCLEGPMFRRWAEHLDKGAVKYSDVAPGVANWTLASSEGELQRFKESALGHMIDWLNGETEEDHCGAIFFNVNAAEYVKEVLNGSK